jgi:hypothetical protein
LYAGDKSDEAIASPIGDITVSWVPCGFYVELTSLRLIMVNKTSISMVLAASVVYSDVEITLETVQSLGDVTSGFTWGDNKFGAQTK